MLPILNDVRQQNREVWRLTICWARCRANADSNSWLWCDWIQQVTIVTVICWDLAHKTPTWRPFCFNKRYDFQWSKPCKNRSFVEVDGFLMLSDQSPQTWQILGAKRVFSSNNKTVAPNLCSLHFGCYRSGTSGAQRLGVFCFSKQPIATKQKSPRETQEAETRKAIFIKPILTGNYEILPSFIMTPIPSDTAYLFSADLLPAVLQHPSHPQNARVGSTVVFPATAGAPNLQSYVVGLKIW